MTIHRNLAICAYCGQAFDVDPTAPHHEIVSACAKHAQECERNPLVQEIARLKAEVARKYSCTITLGTPSHGSHQAHSPVDSGRDCTPTHPGATCAVPATKGKPTRNRKGR